MTLTVYGLKNCDTCRKALKWLDMEDIPYTSVDVRTDGVPSDVLQAALEKLGWQVLLNKSSTTWRSLDENDKADLDNASALALLETHATLMKRPLFVMDGTYICGFRDKQKDELLSLVG